MDDVDAFLYCMHTEDQAHAICMLHVFFDIYVFFPCPINFL